MSRATLQVGDCVDVMATMAVESVDAIVTDPPYGLEFMGKEWDKLARPKPGNLGGFATGDKPSFARVRKHLGAMIDWHADWAAASLLVAKPGAHLVAFGGTRTHQYLMLGLELAGWEVRDAIGFLGLLGWTYGSGFPKSHNLTGEHDGKGTALKPAWEPIVLARKPLDGTVAENVQRHGTGALNVDTTRIGTTVETWPMSRGYSRHDIGSPIKSTQATGIAPKGRWPANVVLDQEAAAALDEQAGPLSSGAGNFKRNSAMGYKGNALGAESRPRGAPMLSYGDSGGASRFFYCAKASRAEREAGLRDSQVGPVGSVVNSSGRGYRLRCRTCGKQNARTDGSGCACAEPDLEYDQRQGRNHHPTVKPVALLMRWLVRLITPPGGLVLDPFVGSGTTGVACVLEGFRFLGIDQDPEYIAIAQGRIAHAEQQPSLFEAGT